MDSTHKPSPFEVDFCRSRGFPLSPCEPFERLREMLLFVNHVNLYQGTSAKSGKRMLTWIPPESGLTVYDIGEWEEDSWDALDYGRDYDFSRPFFPQFAALFSKVPVYNLSNIISLMENSDYTNCIGSAKNCYLIFEATEVEDCSFSFFVVRSRNIIDSTAVADCELCYSCKNIRGCYNLKFGDDCSGCSDSFFLDSCQNCRHCYGCVNLTQKEYHWYNQPLTKEDYVQKLSEIDLGSHSTLSRERERFSTFRQTFPQRAMNGRSNENSAGNYLNHTKNCHNCFFVSDSEDCEHSLGLVRAKNSIYYAAYGNDSELIYNTVHSGDSAYELRYCFECWMNVQNLEYCGFCTHGASHCFGCVSVKRRSYCILNKQYSKTEYEALLPRIRSHMKETGEYGRFFPPFVSPHSYNMCATDAYLPLPREQVLERGLRWHEESSDNFTSTTTLPDHINDVPDGACDWTLRCESSGKPYRLTAHELRYYREQRLSPPRIAPMVRVKALTRYYALHPLQQISCRKCSSNVPTVYGNGSRKVLCDSCFQEQRLET